MTMDLLERLRAMPSSLNDALRTLDFAAAYIEELQRLERIDALIAGQLSQSMTINAQLKNRIEALEAVLRQAVDDLARLGRVSGVTTEKIKRLVSEEKRLGPQ